MVDEGAATGLAALQAAGLLTASVEGVFFSHEWLRDFLAMRGLSGDEPLGDGSIDDKCLLGLTGNIAVGKSTVLGMLEALGAAVIDADALVHELRAPGAAGYQPMIDLLGEDILQADGNVDRAKLAARAFGEPGVLRQLEALFHPLVQQEVAARVAASEKRVVVIEAIKLLEGRLKHDIEAVWVVDATPDTRIERLVTMRGLRRETAARRVAGQNPQAEKLAQADVIIHNDGDLDATWAQVIRAWDALLDSLWQRRLLTQALVQAFITVRMERAQVAMTTAQAQAALLQLAGAMSTVGVLPQSEVLALLSDVV